MKVLMIPEAANHCRNIFGAWLAAGLLLSAPRAQAQVNDYFANRVRLTGIDVTVEGNNSEATTEAGEEIAGGILVASVWYAWTAPTNGVLHVSGSTPIPTFVLNIATYQGTAINALTPTTPTLDYGIAVRAGETIQVQVAGVHWQGGTRGGPFTLHLFLDVDRPTSSNDAFGNALSIDRAQYHFDASLTGATNEPGEPLPGPNAEQTLWWKFEAPENGVLNILLAASQFVPSQAVYEGTELASLLRVNPISSGHYAIQGGRTYAVQVGGNTSAGNFRIDVRFHSGSNDFFSGSEHLEGTNMTYYGNFSLATPEPNEPASGSPKTVWVSWAAPFTGPFLEISLATAPYAQYLRVFTGPSVEHLQELPSGAIAVEGTVYHFQISGDADDFLFRLRAEPFQSADNDHFANAATVSGEIISFAPKSTVGATMELGEPLHMGPVAQQSIWWKWQAPRNGILKLSGSSGHIPNVVLAVYQGPSVDALGLVRKGTNEVQFSAVDGATYYIAAAVPAGAMGNVTCSAQMLGLSTATLLPGNLLVDPSFEAGGVGWETAGDLGGYIGERGGVDGLIWPVLSTGARLWQTFPTIPGRNYALQFAYRTGGPLSACCGAARFSLSWDARDLGMVDIPESEVGLWHWKVFIATATNTNSTISFRNISRNIEMDAFSVVDLNAAPTIVTQPSTISTVAGGLAAFIVGANGTVPLSYQWFFQGQPMPGQNAPLLVLDPVTSADAGKYHVVVTNAFGKATSAPASLLVDAPTNATILLQPYAGVMPAGSYLNLSVVAAGTPPLRYQWYFNSEKLPGATNRDLVLPTVQLSDAGSYEVRVHNYAGSVWSLPATLIVTNPVAGGGTILFDNRFLSFNAPSNEAPIFDLDGITRLNGPTFVAQLYAGSSLDSLRPAASPSPFRSGFDAGLVAGKFVTLPNVPPGATAFAQVRAWEITRGSSYEEARAMGGKFGRSDIFEVVAGGDALPPAQLSNLKSFHLQAGLPEFTVGVIEFVERQPQGVLVWSVHGTAGFRYVVEKALRSNDLIWRPYVVLTNVTGNVTFTDSTASQSSAAFYRARILD